MAAGLGFTAVLILMLLLWTTSPYPGGGLSGAAQLTADLWLLAHGVELSRPGTGGGGPVPLGLPPLLLTALPVWLLHRAARSSMRGPERAGPAVVGWLSAGYLLPAAAVVVYASDGPMRPVLSSAALLLPVFALVVTAAGMRAAVRRYESAALWSRASAAFRAAKVGAGAMCGAGALLVAGSLVWHAQAVRDSVPLLTDGWPEQLALLALSLTLLPNAAVWGAAYGLGPGFALGADSVVAPLAAGEPHLVTFPLLAAVPDGPGGWHQPWALAGALTVPVAAALLMAGSLARGVVPVPGGGVTDGRVRGRGETVLTALLAAVGCGVLTAVLAAFAGGPVGRGGLAEFGPDGWLVGAAATGWTAALTVPAALVLRTMRRRGGWRLRRRRAAEPPSGPEGWYGAEARRLRWAAMRTQSGGLMADFPPRRPAGPCTGLDDPSPPPTEPTRPASPTPPVTGLTPPVTDPAPSAGPAPPATGERLATPAGDGGPAGR